MNVSPWPRLKWSVLGDFVASGNSEITNPIVHIGNPLSPCSIVLEGSWWGWYHQKEYQPCCRAAHLWTQHSRGRDRSPLQTHGQPGGAKRTWEMAGHFRGSDPESRTVRNVFGFLNWNAWRELCFLSLSCLEECEGGIETLVQTLTPSDKQLGPLDFHAGNGLDLYPSSSPTPQGFHGCFSSRKSYFSDLDRDLTF